jgi:hypothetical protein
MATHIAKHNSGCLTRLAIPPVFFHVVDSTLSSANSHGDDSGYSHLSASS